MFNTVRPQMAFVVAVAVSVPVALIGAFSVAGESRETFVVRRGSDQTIEIIHADGTTTKIPPAGQFLHDSPDGIKLVTAAEAAAEAENESAKRSPSVTGDAQKIAIVRRLTDQAIEIIYADGTKETITIRRNLADQTTEILNVDGTTSKLPSRSRTSPARSKNVSAVDIVAEAANKSATPPLNAGPPDGRPINPLIQSAHRNPLQPRFQVSPAGNSAILLDTVSGKTWLLYYPDRKILSRLNEERGRTWKGMPCIWLPLHRPETDAEIEQILAREQALRKASDKLRAEEQKQAEEERRKAFGIGGTRRNPNGTPAEPNGE